MSRKSRHTRSIPIVRPIEEPAGAVAVQTCDPVATGPAAGNGRGSPTQEDVSMRAREIWEVKGCPLGRDLEIWLCAERDLTGNRS